MSDGSGVIPDGPGTDLWNAACGDVLPEHLEHLRGSMVYRAMQAVVSFHGRAMNGGVLHSIEGLDHAEAVTVFESFRLLRQETVAHELALLVAEYSELDDAEGEEFEERAEDWYYAHYADDAALIAAVSLAVDEYAVLNRLASGGR